MTNTETLGPENVLDLVIKSLGEGQPTLKTPFEAVALIGHACMVAVGFRLVGLGEDHNLGETILLLHNCSPIADRNRIIYRDLRPPRRMEH